MTHFIATYLEVCVFDFSVTTLIPLDRVELSVDAQDKL